MGNIKLMSKNLSNKIAAGEVVEKISNVVKELVENSIDALSTKIKIELVDSGTKSIKVTDDGIGMDESDAILCFSRHATSKIKTENDLYFISTLGFRGEALASIASVSKITLITCKNSIGTKVILESGNIIYKEKDSARIGTSIDVSEIFYNTPARLKFLRSFNTELSNIVSVVENLALSHSNISFILLNNGKEILHTNGNNDLLKTIFEIYGYNISKNMIKVSNENYDYSIDGYVSNINISSNNNSKMITFVNGRIIRNAYLNKIIRNAYHTFLPDIKYPIIVLNITADPTLIDVNIHPTKQDIKFSKIDSLEDLVFSTIRKKLNETNNIVKAYEIEEKKELEIEEKKIIEEVTLNFEENNSISDKFLINPTDLVFGTYLVAQGEEEMYLIDIHAANERINYEKYLDGLKKEIVNTIELLIPINIELSKSDYIIIQNNKDFINSIGINYEEFGINTIRIISHPTWIKKYYEEESIRKIIDLILFSKEKFDRVKYNEKIAITLACKMSVKANTNISFNEKEELLKRLFNCEFPYTCPHGRPTIIRYKKYELEKMFKRVMN